MKRSTFARLGLLVGVLTVLLALQGCGGDDGVDQSLFDQTQMELDTAKADAAAAQIKADEDAATAAAALKKAEDDAAAAQIKADEDAATAAAALKKAEDDAAAALKKVEDDAAAALKKVEGDAAAAMMAVQTAASDAATAAMTASGNAADAAMAAKDARATIATQQTGSTSGMLAYEAHDAANMAMTAYMDAKAASDDAQAATDIAAATAGKIKAEAAQAMAESYAMTAGEKSTASQDAVMMELMIDDKTKTVGDTSITIDGQSQSATINSVTRLTGLLEDMNLMSTVAAEMGTPMVDDVDGTEADETMPAIPGVGEGTVDIGFRYDSANDDARLALVHSYAGTKNVKAYVAESGGTAVTTTTKGRIQIDGADTMDNSADDVFSALRAVGMYYPVVSSQDGSAVTDGVIDEDVRIPGGAKAVQIYEYVSTADDPDTADTDEEEKTNVRLSVTNTPAGGDTTYTYEPVVLGMGVAKLPAAKMYEHIHFGVWSGLKEASDNGVNEIADLGIGFVQNFSDGGMTGDDMPNNGFANYVGDWVANVREAATDGDGDITQQFGAAMLEADFGKGTITANLTDLARLAGKIDGNTFAGDKVSFTDTDGDADNVTAGGIGGLDTTDGEFTGEFTGGFYGAKAAEAGGVFDFTSEDMEAGEFRGAFGGGRDDN